MEIDLLRRLASDMLGRHSAHNMFWFSEVEHQFGLEKALSAMDYVEERLRPILNRRLQPFLPLDIAGMPEEQLTAFTENAARNWIAMDGLWFQAIEFTEGMFDAKRCNDSAWAKFSPFEAHAIKRLLGMGEHPGLEGLKTALHYRMFSPLSLQSFAYDEAGGLVCSMNVCRTQLARQRKNLPDYPCKSGGSVEYKMFARYIDPEIRTECVFCPPDQHPEGCFCRWRFTIGAAGSVGTEE